MRTINTTIFIIIASVLFAAGQARAQALSQPQRDDANLNQAANVVGGPAVSVGDKLKISFYETLDLSAAKQSKGDPQAPLRTFYQRMDLSGEYTVEQDGAIAIPLLGRFQVEGQDLDNVRADLGTSFVTVTGHNADIDVKIAERLPVYVVGPVKNPGAYKYVPGMIVLQAVALAGGLDQGPGGLTNMIEGVRQIERLQTATLNAKRLFAKRARLEAERDRATALPIPVQLTDLGGGQASRTFVTTESAILHAEQMRRQQQIREIAVKAAAARREVEALRRKLEQIDVQKAMRIERLKDMQNLKDRGLQTTNTVVLLRTELSDIESRRQDYLVSIVQAEARLASEEEADERLSAENSISVAKAIATVDQEIATTQETMESARGLAAMLYRPIGRVQSYEIVRRTKDGTTTIKAAETAPMMPGDVLKVDLGSAAIEPALIAPMPQHEPTGSYIKAATE